MDKTLTGRKCYDHLGGKLGKLLFERMLQLEWIRLMEGKATVYEVTGEGRKELGKLGIFLE